MSSEILGSKFPVGSSARITRGFFTKALAIATLCFCPPLRLFGWDVILFSNPTL